MPHGSKVEKGKRNCKQCGTAILLKKSRDLSRKWFCSRSCSSRFNYNSKCFTPGTFGNLSDEEQSDRRRRQSDSMKKSWMTLAHPMNGKNHSEESRAKISESQKKRLLGNPGLIQRGENHPLWKGGKTKNGPGYVLIRISGRYYLEHRIIAQGVIGRSLLRNEVVHHKNHVKNDNRPENLEVMTQDVHCRLHRLGVI